MKQVVLFIITIIASRTISAQGVGIGQWEDFLSYKSGISVAEGGGKAYCATKSGIFSLDKSDNSIERLSKINGLADVEATVLGYNHYSNKLIIAYKNSNIDVIDNGLITNLSDIKRKPILGNKSINNVYFINQYAYLACGFGIVVIDMNKVEVSDTYYIGPNGSPINVRDITSDADYLYAATDAGIYRASVTNPNLANYSAWSLMSGLPGGVYNTVTEFNGKIYTNFSKLMTTGAMYQDTAYVYDGTSWTYFMPPNGFTIKSLRKCNGNTLVMAQSSAVLTYDTNLTLKEYISDYFNSTATCEFAVMDNSGNIWIADNNFGMVGWRPGMGIFSYLPDGPTSPNAAVINIRENTLAVAPGGGGNGYFMDGLYSYNGTSWTNTKGNFPSVVNLDTVTNINNVLVDPNNSKRIYAATGLVGIIEFNDGVPTTLYNHTNSSLQRLSFPGYTPIWTSGLAFDGVSNLWIGNSGVPLSVSVKKNDGTWQALDFSPIIGNTPEIGHILVDRNDQKWIVLARGGGLLVYNGTASVSPNSSNAKKLTTAAGNGALPSNYVVSMAEDLDGEIWVGTDKGITVFYSPESVFSGDNFDSQQILIEQDGHVQILLETELIQSIAVDGANRKWIATQNSGVFLMSADGTQEIHHFDISNSPLFSNDVKSIAINHQTGVVYFGTTKGIIAYRGTATGSGEFFTDVYSFPNPVKPTYDGPIAIKGLVNNTIVKITDISGSLVYETLSEGGQAIWNGKNFNGQRVNSGVYMVFCASQDGTQKMVSKILFIN